jgi:hypothetical protein
MSYSSEDLIAEYWSKHFTPIPTDWPIVNQLRARLAVESKLKGRTLWETQRRVAIALEKYQQEVARIKSIKQRNNRNESAWSAPEEDLEEERKRRSKYSPATMPITPRRSLKFRPRDDARTSDDM